MWGGGNYITQSFPTNFHKFWTSKILTAGEKIEDFKEVTPAERAQLEADDAKWVRPPQAFIDLWNTACLDMWEKPVGCYNESTGFFEVNGLKDITYQQAMTIYQLTAKPSFYFSNYANAPLALSLEKSQIRTNLPQRIWQFTGQRYDRAFAYCANLEVAVISAYYGSGESSPMPCAFQDCKKLKRIINRNPGLQDAAINISAQRVESDYNATFMGCISLEEVKITNLRLPLNFKDCGKLNYESFNFMISNAAASLSSAITVTVHSDIYAALQGEAPAYPVNGGSREQWTQLLQQAAERQILFAAA